MSLNPGDRVEWVYNEPSADPSELHGEIIEVIFMYKVKWDDGSVETVDEDDVKKEGT